MEGMIPSYRPAEFPTQESGKFRWTVRRGKRFGFRLYCLSPISSVLRYEDRDGVVGTGGCRRKGNALASRCAHQGIIVWGFTLVSAAVRAWLARERTRCRRWRRREGREVRACSGFHGGASLLLRQNDQQHVLQDALVLSDDHDHPPVSSPSFHHVSSRQVFSHAAALSESRAMRRTSVRVTW